MNAGEACTSAAYFDLDKTVLATSTTMALGGPMRRSGLITVGELARGVVAQLPYLIVGADERSSTRLMNRLAALTTGWTRSEFHQVVIGALHSAIEPAVHSEALDLIEAHHQAGQDVIIVSASVRETVEPVSTLVGADRCLATELETVDGIYTGRVTRSLLHGAKVTAIETDAAEHGIDLSTSWAYSDSISDLPMLELVGHPVVVNPDRDLRRIATERGWPIRHFDRPVALRRAWSTPDGARLRDLAPDICVPNLETLPQESYRIVLLTRLSALLVVSAICALSIGLTGESHQRRRSHHTRVPRAQLARPA